MEGWFFFLRESDILKSRFLEKGYEEEVLDQIICDVGDKNRKQLLVPQEIQIILF